MIHLCALLLLFSSLLNYAYYRDGLAPSVVQPTLWCFLLAGAATVQDTFFELSQETLFLSVMASLLFQVGFFLSWHLARGHGGPVAVPDAKAALRFRNILFCIVIVILPFYVHTAYSIATSGPVNDPAYNLRYSLSEGERGFGVLAYGVTVALFLVIVESIFFDARRKSRLVVAALVGAVFCVLLTGRTFILALLICVVFPLILNGKVRPSRGLLALLCVFLPLFYVYSVTLGKDGGGGVDSMLDVFKLYLYGGLFAFDKLAQSLLPHEHGAHLFRVFFLAANIFDPPVEVAPLVDDYVFLPEPTNVYTVFGKAFRDFGSMGVVIYMLFVGMCHGFIYRRAGRGSVYYRILLVYSFFVLLMQFFQDQYLGILSTWIQVIALTCLFAVFTRGRRARAYRGRPSPQGLPCTGRGASDARARLHIQKGRLS
jgi:oligosaccharide repeat unit polymerase